MDKIQIGIACGYNCERYVDFMIQSILRTAANVDKLTFLLCVSSTRVNTGFLDDVMRKSGLQYTLFHYIIVGGTLSHNHGQCLDQLLTKMSTDIGMIIDCDVVMLEPKWDITLPALLDDKHIILGSEYDGQKYKNFPNAIFCMFKTKILRDLKISFLPRGSIIVTEADAILYEVPCDSKIYLDVGCELPVKIKKAGYSGIPMRMASHGRTAHDCKFMMPGMNGEEYQYNNIPYCSHVGRSSTRDFDCDAVKKWRDRTEEWLKKMNESLI
jgi:hypothetical protein